MTTPGITIPAGELQAVLSKAIIDSLSENHLDSVRHGTWSKPPNRWKLK